MYPSAFSGIRHREHICNSSDTSSTSMMHDNTSKCADINQRATTTSFKEYDYRLVACNGDCGSNFSKLIDCCVHQKDLERLHNLNDIIMNAFWCYGDPLRNLLINLMQRKRIHKSNKFYQEIYQQLNDKNCFVEGYKWINKIKSLLLMLSIDHHQDILQKMANSTCNIPNRSLLQEIDAYYNRNLNQLKQKLCIIQSMINSNQFKDINCGLLQKKQMIQNQIQETLPKIDRKAEYKNKIKKIKQSSNYKLMKEKKMELTDAEILSIILYCDYNIFVYKLRESQREQHLNSCQWKKLFYYLHSAINKMHKSLHFKNHNFYQKYIEYRKPSNNKLFRGIYGVSLECSNSNNLSLQTVTSFTECFGIAKSFTYDQGMVLVINNAYKAIYDGHLKSANVSWISKYTEKEWIVLPITFKSVSKIQDNNVLYDKYIRDPKYISIYAVNIIESVCHISTCNSLRRIILILYWYNKMSNIPIHTNTISQYIKNKEKGCKYILSDCRHIFMKHYDVIKYEDDKVFLELLHPMRDYGITINHSRQILKHIIKFIKIFDMLNGEKKDNSFMTDKHIEIVTDFMENMTESIPITSSKILYPIICDSLNEFVKYSLAFHYFVQDIQLSLCHSLPLQFDLRILPKCMGYGDINSSVHIDPALNFDISSFFKKGNLKTYYDDKNNANTIKQNKVNVSQNHNKIMSIERYVTVSGSTKCYFVEDLEISFMNIKQQMHRMWMASGNSKCSQFMFIVDRGNCKLYLVIPKNDKFCHKLDIGIFDDIKSYKFGISYKLLTEYDYESHWYVNRGKQVFALDQIARLWPIFFDKVDSKQQVLNMQNATLLYNAMNIQFVVSNSSKIKPFQHKYLNLQLAINSTIYKYVMLNFECPHCFTELNLKVNEIGTIKCTKRREPKSIDWKLDLLRYLNGNDSNQNINCKMIMQLIRKPF